MTPSDSIKELGLGLKMTPRHSSSSLPFLTPTAVSDQLKCLFINIAYDVENVFFQIDVKL